MADRRKGLLLSACVSIFLLASFIGGDAVDVPDGAVYTDLHKTVQKGNEIVLNCDFYGVPIAVYWKKGDDPERGTDLISWVYEEEISGSCFNNKACHMTDDYSLVIGDARIADQGRYICRVSNYLGILIHNYTDVEIIAPPKEPYPVIDKCAEEESSVFNSTHPCRILTNSTIIITCSAMNYYPELDLFFLHGSQKMTDILPREKTNSDETKNKSISIKASASETPYVCVASGIPGSKDQTAATIFVESSTGIPITRENERPSTPSTSNTATTTISTGNRAAQIVVPIFVILIIGAVVLFAFLWKKHPRLFRRFTTGDSEAGRNGATTIDLEEITPMVKKATIAGDISFFEMWSLAYDTPSDEMKKIHQVLLNLGIKEVKVGLPAPDIYELLCKWKDGTRKEQHVKLLQSAMKSAELERRWMDLCEQRLKTDVKVSQVTLDQIILDIKSPPKIQRFLRKLIPQQADNIDVPGAGTDPIVEATELLRRWRNGPFTENPNAVVSLALERCGCSQVDRTFFAGMVSFFELWSMSRKMTVSEGEARDTLKKLGLSLADALTEEDIYFHLCTWKEANTTSNQGKLLRDALERANCKEVWKEMKELREKSDANVSDKILEHIVWHIQDPEKIGQFLQKLTFNDSETCLDVSQRMKDIIKDAMGHLVKWKQQRFDANPIVLLSHALDKTACKPVDRSFFKVPFELMANIIEFEVEGFVDSLTKKHVTTMAPFLDIGKIGKTIHAINEENRDTIFNTKTMITEWIEQVECSHYEKRWRLNEAITEIGRQDLTDYFGKNQNPEIHLGVEKGTISSAHSKGHTMKRDNLNLSYFVEDELQRITTYLSSSQMKELFGIVDDDPQNELRAYVERLMAENPKQNWRDKLRKKLKSAELKVLIPYALASNVYLCELHDVAFRLLLDDVYPLAEALDISGERLKKYRVDYTPDHLTQGTNAALIKFCETNGNNRGKVREALFNAGYKNIAVLLYYGHEPSLADELAVASRAGDSKEDLTKIPRNLGVSHSSNTGTVLRDWKDMVHPPTYNHRTALADAVFPVLGVDVAIAILSGKYREDGNENPGVIQTISTTIESFELSILKKILEDKDSKLQDQQVTINSQETQVLGESGSGNVPTDIHIQYILLITLKLSKILGVGIEHHSSADGYPVTQVLETWEENISKKSLSKDEWRELSDDLLRAGFKQFAFEIMTGFVSRPKKLLEKLKKKGKQDQKSKRDEQSKQGKQEEDKEHVNQKETEQQDVDGSVDTMDRNSIHGKGDLGKEESDAQTNEDTNDGGDDKGNEESNEPDNKVNDEHSSGNEDQGKIGQNDQAVEERSSQEEQVVLND